MECDKNNLKWQKHWQKLICCALWLLSFVHVPSANIDKDDFITYAAASHQGVVSIALTENLMKNFENV